ncbi:MAG: TIGR02757 family protein, partial [Bacteroidales bacterium]
KLMAMMDHDPYDFIMNAGDKDFNSLNAFYHRTFCGIDTIYFLKALSNIYRNLGGLETLFTKEYIRKGDIRDSLIKLREIFFGSEHPARTEKHLADIRKGASAKRLNMFLRWMVRKDHGEVDFGLWSRIPSSALYIPLDVHSGSTARDLGILKRKQNDWNAVCELTFSLKELDPSDPVKYDFALFGIGAFEKTASKREYDAK